MCDKHRFVFEFDKAYVDQIIQKLEKSPAHPLATHQAPPEKGVYALYRRKKLVYAGKALNTSLRRRLAEHAKKIAGRNNIAVSEMRCRYLIIDSDWFVRAGEHASIESYDPEWNASGFVSGPSVCSVWGLVVSVVPATGRASQLGGPPRLTHGTGLPEHQRIL
jgi:hypothetical protein